MPGLARVIFGKQLLGAGLLAASALLLAGCQIDEFGDGQKHLRPLSYAAQERLQSLGMKKNAPIMVRIYKQEAELEIWKQSESGRYVLFKTYQICRWSGKFGPKIAEGDRQAPEGFYLVTPALMNPASKYYLSFNLGFPNRFDRAYGRTGSHLMVHGSCSSRGCYAMTDEQMQEIYSMAREAFRGGQDAFQVQAFPFRMTAENFVQNKDSEHLEFWKMLKRGHDHFEVAKVPPKLDVCDRKYVFNAVAIDESARFDATRACPTFKNPPMIAEGVAKLEAEHEAKVAAILQDLEEKRLRAEKWDARSQKVAKLLDFGSDAKPAPAEAAAEAAPVLSAPVPDAPITAAPELAAEEGAAEVRTEPASRGALSRMSRLAQFIPGFGGANSEPAATPSPDGTGLPVVPAAKPR